MASHRIPAPGTVTDPGAPIPLDRDRVWHVVTDAGQESEFVGEILFGAEVVGLKTGDYLWLKNRGYLILRFNAHALNSGYIMVDQPIAWFKWHGTYEKQHYDVWVKGCDVVLACWPNDGKMCTQDGSGREWTQHEILAVRVSEYQGRYPRPFPKAD